MPIHATAAALLAITAIASACSVGTANAGVTGALKCHTTSVHNEPAAKVIDAMAANIAGACGFTVSGPLLGARFGVDGLELDGTTTYDREGDVHAVLVDQGVVIDVYRIGQSEYARLYEYGKPNAAPDANVRAFWHAYGVTSNAVIDAAGSAKWVKLTSGQRKTFNGSGSAMTQVGLLGSPASLAAALTEGTGRAWKLSGTKTIDGVACLVLTDPGTSDGLFPAETLYVNKAVGVPVEIHYASQDRQVIITHFGRWGRTAAITAPARSKVVGG